MVNEIDVLIVEDSLLQTTKLANFLNQNKYKTHLARNGREALDILKKYRPKLILSDILMPEMDGYELCSKIKADASLRDIPVILLTQLSNPRDVFKGLECGADNFITKPFKEDFLLSQIEHILVNKKFRQQTQMEIGMDIFFSGKKHFINSDRFQIIDMLLSTYETAIQKNRELDQTRINFQNLLETNADAIVVVDKKNLIQYLNPAAIRLFEFEKGNWEDRQFFISVELGKRKEFQVPQKDGEYRTVEMRVVETNWEGKAALLASIRDITERKIMEEQLERMARYDHLTSIFNRRYLLERASQEFKKAKTENKPFSMIMFDVDHFKKVNDTYNHQVGDQVLTILVQICKNELEKNDLFGRLGGEEFGVFLPDTDLAKARRTAEKLRQKIESTIIPSSSGPVTITISLGVASTAFKTGGSLEILIHMTDEALYVSKNSGRNRVSFSETY